MIDRGDVSVQMPWSVLVGALTQKTETGARFTGRVLGQTNVVHLPLAFLRPGSAKLNRSSLGQGALPPVGQKLIFLVRGDENQGFTLPVSPCNDTFYDATPANLRHLNG